MNKNSRNAEKPNLIRFSKEHEIKKFSVKKLKSKKKTNLKIIKMPKNNLFQKNIYAKKNINFEDSREQTKMSVQKILNSRKRVGRILRKKCHKKDKKSTDVQKLLSLIGIEK